MDVNARDRGSRSPTMQVAAVLLVCALSLVAAGCGKSPAQPTSSATPARDDPPRAVQANAVGDAPRSVPGHPRLFVGRRDVARLRSWATPRNPMYSKGLAVLAREAKRIVDEGHVPDGDGGSDGNEEYTTEAFAELFAFMSLIERREPVRADYGRRARDLLMAVMRKAAPGVGGEDEPFRDRDFATGDRSRWNGEAFAFTVDWAYPYFSAQDKKLVRKVFLRWSREQFDAYPLDFIEGRRPTAGGRRKDPALTANVPGVRESLNNYYLAHARNLGLMAMALDPGDDPGGRLRRYLGDATGQWLFTIDHALRTQARGGLSPEGFEYGPEAVGRVAQLLYALRTAGERGPRLADNPFWSDSIGAFLSSLPPRPTRLTGDSAWRGEVWQPALYGSAQDYWAGDPISLFAPLALDAAARGDSKTLQAIRWIAVNVPPGRRERLYERVGNTDQFFPAMLYFLLFDPDAPAPADPRPALPLRYFAPGLNRTLARTCWCTDGRLFAHKLSWNQIDHQIADGNDFALFRAGEWLTRQRAQYSSGYIDYTNTLAVQNDAPEHNEEDDPRHQFYLRGGQWEHNPAGDPNLIARSFGDHFVALTGDATNLYNDAYEGIHDVEHVSRSIVWLEPDHIVVYDRARTGKAGRFKRFWLQLPSDARIAGKRATARTARGQQLIVTSLLPTGASLESSRDEDVGGPVEEDAMRFHLRIEQAGDPKNVRFLTVLQGADGGAPPDAATHLHSDSGTPYDGARVAGQAVLFPVDLRVRFAGTTIEIPAQGLQRILVTGLQAGRDYAIRKRSDGARLRLTVSPGRGSRADEGGVLVLRP